MADTAAPEIHALDAALAAYWDLALSDEPLGSHKRMAAALAAATQSLTTPRPADA